MENQLLTRNVSLKKPWQLNLGKWKREFNIPKFTNEFNRRPNKDSIT